MDKLLRNILSALSLVLTINYGHAQLPPFSCSMGNNYSSITGNPGPAGDDVTITVPIGFTFNYVGNNYTQASICTNGFAILGTSTFSDFTVHLCGNNAGQRPMLAPFWTDLNTSNGGNIKYITLGTAPNRNFVVQFDSVAFFAGYGRVTFQLRLYETTNLIEFLYGPGIANPSARGAVGINRQAGTPNCMSIAPGPTCDSTIAYTNIELNGLPYIFPNLGPGVKYTFGSPAGIISHEETPKVFKLYSNYPNPFNPSTTIKFDVAKLSDLKIIVYNSIGEAVSILTEGRFKPGSYSINWDGSNFASDLYVYKIISEGFNDAKKMLLLK